MGRRFASLCLVLVIAASCQSLYADQIAHFTAIQPLDTDSGPNHVEQVVTFDLVNGAPVSGTYFDAINFMITTSAVVHIANVSESAGSVNDTDVLASLEFFNDGVTIAPTGLLGFPFIPFQQAPLSNFFTGPVTAPVFVPGIYAIFGPDAGNSLTIDVPQVPEPATLSMIGTGMTGLFAMWRRRNRSHSVC